MAYAVTKATYFIAEQEANAVAELPYGGGKESAIGLAMSDSNYNPFQLMVQYIFAYQRFLAYPFWAMAMFHLILVLTFSPAVFKLVAGIYNLGQWACYTMAFAFSCMVGQLMLAFMISQKTITGRLERMQLSAEINKLYFLLHELIVYEGVLCFIMASYLAIYACMMPSIGDVYYQYAQRLDKTQARKEQKQACNI